MTQIDPMLAQDKDTKCETCANPLNYDEVTAGDITCQWCDEEYEGAGDT